MGMGGLSCGASCMKYILFLFNIVFFISGAAILGVGIWLKVDPDAANVIKVVELNDGSALMSSAIWVLIGIGAFIFFVGFLGCCGACRESSCMLTMYAALLIIIFISEIAVAIMALVYKGKITSEMKEKMKKQVRKDVTLKTDDAVTVVWNTLQYQFKCCGAENAKDYDGSHYANESDSDSPIPQTCCKMDKLKISLPEADNYKECVEEYKTGTENRNNLYYTGCYDGMKNWISDHTGILVGIGFGIAVVQLFGIIFACCVGREIGRNDQGL